MDLNRLTAISPIDGRYRQKIKDLDQYFSEFGLIKYRLKVEIDYFKGLCDLPLPQLKQFSFPAKEIADIVNSFSIADAQRIKDIEKITNHDVKAVEYFLKEKFEELKIGNQKEFIHFGLTSQDINNTAIPLLLKDATEKTLLPELIELRHQLQKLASDWDNVPMLARTHGQPASPTRLGKEFSVFISRLDQQLVLLKEIPFAGKFGGATGNFNAHFVAYPEIDWHQFAQSFLENMGLKRSFPTTQIEHYDYISALFDNLKRINTILIDLCRDIWHYISINYFKQKINKNEVGSSTMPHKVNPIDFENAEGNLGVANAVFEHLSAKLPISRLQRDLTDSTVLRNVGVPFAHTMIALDSLAKGLNKLELNKEAIDQDLQDNWVVITEGIQTILRRAGFPEPYEVLKDFTRQNKSVTSKAIEAFVNTLEIEESVKQEIRALTPFNYTGK